MKACQMRRKRNELTIFDRGRIGTRNNQNGPRDHGVTIVQSLSPKKGEQSIQSITSLKLSNKFLTTIRHSDEAINRHKILQNLLTRGALSKVNNIIIWHDVINNSIWPHRSNNYQPRSIDQLIENLLLFKNRIKAIVYSRRLGTGDIKRWLFGSQIIITDAIRKLISHRKSKDSTILSDLRQAHPSAALEFKLLSVVWYHRNHV